MRDTIKSNLPEGEQRLFDINTIQQSQEDVLTNVKNKPENKRTSDDEKKVKRAEFILEKINALKELGLQFDISSYEIAKERNTEYLKQVDANYALQEQFNIYKNIGKEKSLQDELDSIHIEKINLLNKSALTDMTTNELDLEMYKLKNKEAQAIYDWNKKDYELKKSISEQFRNIQNIGREKTLATDLSDIDYEIAQVRAKDNREGWSNTKINAEIMPLNTKRAQLEFDWSVKNKTNQSEINKLQRERIDYSKDLTAEQKYQNTYNDILIKKQNDSTIPQSQIELEIEQAKTELFKERVDLTKQYLNNYTDIINTATSGSTMTPKYDLSSTFGKMSNSLESGGGYFGKANLNPKDYAQVFNFALTQTSNVWKTINGKQIEAMNHEVSMLEIKKQLATSEEERQRIDNEILNKKLAIIDKETQTKQQESIMGGITGGIGTMAAGGFNPVSIGLGILQMEMGLFGASDAEKQAEMQKEQLIAQEEANQYLAKQTKLLEQQQKFYQTWMANAFSGVNYGFDKALNQEGRTVAGIKYGTKNTPSYTPDVNINKYEDIKSNRDILTNNISSNKSKLIDLQKIIDSKNASEADKWSANFNLFWTQQETVAYVAQLDNLNKLDEEFIKEKKLIYTSYFDWNTIQYTKEQATLDVANKKKTQAEADALVGTVYVDGWKKREDIMNQFIENAKNGANTIANYMGEYTINSMLSAWTRNKTSLNKVLDDVQVHVTNLSDFMSENIDKSFTKLSDFDISKSKWELTTNPIVDLISDYSKLTTEQDKINTQASNFAKIWVEAHGSLSDIIGMLPQFSKDMYNAMQGAFSNTDFVSRFNSIGESLSKTLSDKITKGLMDTKYSQIFTSINNQLTSMMNNNGVTVNGMLGIRNQIMQYSAQIDSETYKTKAMMDLLKMDTNVDYTSQSQQINYETGSTKNNVYNSYNSVNFSIGNNVGNEQSMREFGETLLPYIAEASRNSNLKLG